MQVDPKVNARVYEMVYTLLVYCKYKYTYSVCDAHITCMCVCVCVCVCERVCV